VHLYCYNAGVRANDPGNGVCIESVLASVSAQSTSVSDVVKTVSALTLRDRCTGRVFSGVVLRTGIDVHQV